MPIANDALKMIDLPHAFQEVVNFMPANSGAGACIDGDDERYIYKLFSATSFWRYDTWTNTVQQLANPTGTFGAGTCIRYTKMVGSQVNVVVYGSIYAIVSSGTGAPVFQRYDIGTNVWATLNVTGFAATFGTDGAILFPTPAGNGYDSNYHAGVLRTITASATASVGAVSISVGALPEALPSGAVLNFGTYASPIYAVLTASASAGATSIAVSALQAQVTSGDDALWYGNLYVVGNASAQMYRFNLGAVAWSTTSANSANPTLPAITGAVGAGVGFRWIPGVAGYENKLIIIRGAGTNAVHAYDLVANTFGAISYNPATETFTTGTSSGVVVDPITGKGKRLLISSSNFQNSNVRILELDLLKGRLNPISTLVIYPTSTAVVGDKLTIMNSPDGMTAMFQLLHTSNALVRDFSLSAIS